MDTYKSARYNLKTLILFILPYIMETQRITCPTPCDIGYTCAMVRHGGGPSTPGCITMQEAILLHQALNGGPSGPGSGVDIPANPGGAGFPQQNFGQGFPPPLRRGDPIPGINFLGGNVPQPQNFEQRFEQGIGRQPQTFVPPPGMPGQQGMFGMQGGQFGSPQGGFGMNGPGFLDPTAGQFVPAGVGPANTGMGFRPQLDGGHSHHNVISDNRGNRNIVQHGPNSGVGGGSISSPHLHTGGQGEHHFTASNVGSTSNVESEAPNNNLSNTLGDFIGLSETHVGLEAAKSHENKRLMNVPANNHFASHVPVETPPAIITPPQSSVSSEQMVVSPETSVDTAKQSSTGSRVSRIKEDSFGLHYLFFPRPQSAGIRVNITKGGFCQRTDIVRENGICMNSCYSDRQCPSDHKCCPAGCSLECSVPLNLGQDGALNTQKNIPSQTDTVPAIEAMCVPCQSHLDCNSQDQFCTMSNYCGQSMVCKQVAR